MPHQASRRDERGLFRGVAGLAVVVVAAVGIALAVRSGLGPLPDPDRCTVEVGDVTASFDTEQSENAALITAISFRRGLPSRAAAIALAAAMQESKLRNINRGDRDSLGLFQQRPSQGWGTPSQILDPTYATRRFYQALARVDGWETMSVTEAAQAVQRSAYPDAYAAHEPVAHALANALTGYTPATFDCTIAAPTGLSHETPGPTGLTGRAQAARKDLRSSFGRDLLGRIRSDGASFEIALSPPEGAADRLGWSVAQYAVARAALLDVTTVSYAGRTWKSDGKGWRADPSAADRVRVTVAD